MKRLVLGLAVLMACPALAAAQDTTRTVSVNGFIDTYYAWDFERPTNFDRAFTTQPARHDEFNVNLAHVEMKVAGSKLRGRVALQAGTSVQSNYAGEPRNGIISGPELARLIQEAVAGFQLAPTLWVDGGIYFSHIGQESWISRDNPTYTRSLIADYTPYYETGVKATWQASAKVSAQVHLLNGWQNISETNHSKAVGAHVDVTPTSNLALGYAGFLGVENADTVADHTRIFNELFANFTTGKLKLWVTADFGVQTIPTGGTSTWYGGTAIARYQVLPKAAVAFRVEGYRDADQVIVTTGTPNGFRVYSGSVNFDVTPVAGLLWRVELRGFNSTDAIYPKRFNSIVDTDGFLVTSLALTI